MQSCSTFEPHCSPAGPTFLQRKQHFHCSQQPANQHTNLLFSPGTIHSAGREIPDCPQQSLAVREITWAAPFTRKTPSASQEENMAPVSQSLSARSPELQAMLHPTGQPRNQGLQGKALRSSRSPRTDRQGREALPCQAICAPTSTSAAAQP